MSAQVTSIHRFLAPTTWRKPSLPVAVSAPMLAEPKRGVDLQDTATYHRVDLPGLKQKKWQWDLREHEASYLGNYDFDGKRRVGVVADHGGSVGLLGRSPKGGQEGSP